MERRSVKLNLPTNTLLFHLAALECILYKFHVTLNNYVHRTVWAYSSLNDSVSGIGSQFIPIPDLRRPAADVTLLFLSANGIMFLEPSNDSWYSAHENSSNLWLEPIPGNISAYKADDPVRALGCITVYSFCNPNLEAKDKCTPLAGIRAAPFLAESLWHTEKQKALFNWTANAIINGS